MGRGVGAVCRRFSGLGTNPARQSRKRDDAKAGKQKTKRKIIAACGPNGFVRVYMSDGHDNGCIVVVGTTHFALEIFSGTIYLDGPNFLRFKDVGDCKNPAPYHEFLARVTVLREMLHIGPSNVDISSLKSILGTGSAQFPLTTIHPDYKDKRNVGGVDLSKVCYIARSPLLTTRP